MESLKYFRIIFCFALLLQIFGAPVSEDNPFTCKGELYKFKSGQEYSYGYETNTKLWINDVSTEAESVMALNSTVHIRAIGQCTYQIRLSETSLNGDSLRDTSSASRELDSYSTEFRINDDGELDTVVKFQREEFQWSRNIKRGIISAFQVKQQADLRHLNLEDSTSEQSATVYETDVLGRCRTTYKLEQSSSSIKLNKKKSLQRCTLNENSKSSAFQYVPYKTLPEFFQGRLFIEDYECTSIVERNKLSSVECKEVSTYKIGSRGRLGAQAIVSQRLTYKSEKSFRERLYAGPWEIQSIQYKFDKSSVNEPESADFKAEKFVQDICDKGVKQGLTNEHSDNFKDLVLTIRGYSVDDLKSLFERSKAKCALAGLTVSQALLFADTDNSFEVVLSLMDQKYFDELKYITEYPLLTALARNQDPSESLIEKIKTYLEVKRDDFPYLNKLYLIYSTLIKTRCTKNQCSTSQLNNWSSIFSSNLVDDCSNEAKKELVVSSLKAIGNIGYFANPTMLSNCAVKKDNSLEIRINALQSLRRFSCEQMEQLEHTYDLLQDTNEDTEVRINAFLTLIRCSDQSERFRQFAEKKFADFLLNENDIQLLTFIIDYGKEHSLTTVLNTVLNDPNIKEKFTVNFKELSWNNYVYKYSVMRDSAIEIESSVIFTPKTFIPRSIRLNATVHMFGVSVNFLEANIRLEGLDEILKATIVDNLKSQKLMQRIMQQPEQLIEILKVIADKLKYSAEKPQISVGLRIYGSEVYYSRLDSKEELQKLAELFKGPKDNLYKQIETIKNLFLVDSRVKQPLSNGFEFETTLDISAALLLSKASTRRDSNAKYIYNLENFYSASMSINRRYEVQINNQYRLSLKKKSFFNGRLKLDIDGIKANNTAIYNLNLTPLRELPLITLQGRFYKLKAGEYKEIISFKPEQTQYNKCTSESFKTAFDVELCLNVQRPKASLRESFRYLFIEDIEQSMSEEDEEDNSQAHLNRPSLLLSGPYKYEVLLKNPKMIKAIKLVASLNKDDSKFDFSGDISTKSQSGAETPTLNIAYTREYKLTNRGLINKANLELRRPRTNEVRFQALADFAYLKGEILAGNFVIDNKIDREFLAQLNFGRNNTQEGQIVPNYYLEFLLNSKLVDSKQYRASAQVRPNGKSISSNFLIEARDTNINKRIAEADLKLDFNEQSESSDFDYKVDFKASTFRGRLLTVKGLFIASLLKSDIDLQLDYQSSTYQLPKAKIQLGHMYTGAADTKSYILFNVDAPSTQVKFGTKLSFIFDIEKREIQLVELDIQRPDRARPFVLFFEKKSSDFNSVTGTKLSFGLRDSELDLDKYDLLKLLTKIDGQRILKKFVITMDRKRDGYAKQRTNEITVTKNDKQFMNLKYVLYGDLEKIKQSSTEISATKIGGDIYLNFLGMINQVSANLELDSSMSSQRHNFDFEFKSEGLVQELTKIRSIRSQLKKNQGVINANVEVQKVDDIKSFKLTAQNVRPRGSLNEFDIDYEKKLASGESFTARGTAQYSFQDFKNFETKINVPNHYESSIKLQNRRSNRQDLFGLHSFDFTNKHMDSTIMERVIKVNINNETLTDGNKLQMEFTLTRGPSQQENDLLIQAKTETKMTRQADGSRKLTFADVQTALKTKLYKIDWTTSAKMYPSGNNLNIETKTEANFPGLLSNPDQIRKLTHKLSYSRNLIDSDLIISNEFKTDSPIFGRWFSKLNMDFVRNNKQKYVDGKLNLSYVLANDQKNQKDFTITYNTDYKSLKSTIKQNRVPKISNVLISDCQLEAKFNRERLSAKYLLDILFGLKCNNKLIAREELLIDIDQMDTAPKTTFKIVFDSDVYITRNSLKVEHQKFTKQNGLFKVSGSRDELGLWATELSYTRTINKNSNRLEKGKYNIAFENQKNMNYKCDMDLESNIDYIGNLKCKIDGQPWGLNIKLERPFEFMSGKRSMKLDFELPNRVMNLTYNSNYATPIDGTDDDEDSNDEREFNGTATFHWDFKRDPSKSMTFNLKRDNYAKGKSVFSIEVPNHPRFALLRFKIDRIRTHTETQIKPEFYYQLNNGQSNSLEMTVTMSSDMDTNTFAVETSLQRPKLNIKYENKYEKRTGRLQYLGVRLGNLLKLNIDKESDPEQRKISLEFVNPDASKYVYEARSTDKDNKYEITGVLSQRSRQLSTIKSVFDSQNNKFDVEILIAKTNKKYEMSFAMFNESLANAYVRSEGETLGLASLAVITYQDHHDLALTANWNRMWLKIQQDILDYEDARELVPESSNFNSYFGDVYAVLSSDLKPAVDAIKQERIAIAKDLGLQISNDDKTLFQRYNDFALNSHSYSLWVRQYHKGLSTLIPRLPSIEYNPEKFTKDGRLFDNNLVIKRPTLNARNLYQFNAEYRNYVKQFGENVLFIKRSLMRNTEGAGVKALINKYKYRSLKDYTIVGNVFNRRSIIGFDGEQTVLQSKCRYLLAHETHKNRFSVVLNYNDNQYPISVYAYGQKSVDISYNKAGIDGKPVSLPQTIKLGDNGVMTLTRVNLATCVELNNDLKVCCYEDSNSCTVATTRWFTGKLNGVLGNVNQNVEKIQESQWYLDKTCRYPNVNLRKPSEDAVKQCYGIFGRNSRSLMRNAMMAIRPDGWLKMCSTVLTADPKIKCTVLKAFDHFADQLNVDIEPPMDCYQCSMKSNKYNAGDMISKSESTLATNFEKGSDYVFLTLPCDSKKFKIDFTNFVAELKAKNPLNKYYVVSIDEHDASIYQSSSNEVSNFDLKKAYETLADPSNAPINKQQFKKGLFLAASLFAKRLAQHRFLVIRSCGNCLPYNPVDDIKYSKLINERNVVVHSWGDYKIKNLEPNDDEEDVPIGYGEEDIYLYKPSERTVEPDSLDNYKIEHSADLCQRLAVKSKGTVMDLNQLNNRDIMTSFGTMFQTLTDKYDYEYKLKKCKKLDTPFGDLTDFSYNKIRIERDD